MFIYTLREESLREFSVSTSLSRTLAISTAVLDGAGVADASVGYYTRAAMMFASSALLKTAAYALNTYIIRESLVDEYEGSFPFGDMVKQWRQEVKERKESELELLSSAP